MASWMKSSVMGVFLGRYMAAVRATRNRDSQRRADALMHLWNS